MYNECIDYSMIQIHLCSVFCSKLFTPYLTISHLVLNIPVKSVPFIPLTISVPGIPKGATMTIICTMYKTDSESSKIAPNHYKRTIFNVDILVYSESLIQVGFDLLISFRSSKFMN